MNVDYDHIATRYDSHRHGGGPYLKRIASLAAESRAEVVLEIGAGTGLNTRAFLDVHPCTLIALERSSGMLAKALPKGVPAHWLQGSALELPFAAESVSFIFGVYVIHHLRDLTAAFRECARVLRGGCAAFITAPADFIDRHPMNRYFPSFAKVDRARFQPVKDVEEAFRKAGFASVHTERFIDAPRPIDAVYVERVANRFISTYDLLPSDEFDEGVRRLRADVAHTGRLDIDMVWESTAVWAWK